MVIMWNVDWCSGNSEKKECMPLHGGATFSVEKAS